MPHHVPGNRTLGATRPQIEIPRTIENGGYYLSCPAHDDILFLAPSANFLPSGSPQRTTPIHLMRLPGQTSKSKYSGRNPATICLDIRLQSMSVRSRPRSLGVASLIDASESRQNGRLLGPKISFVSGEPSLPHMGGSLQPPDRQD